MRWKLNVFLAKETGHFQKFRFAQDHSELAVRAWDCLAKIAAVKPDMNATGRAEHF
jgi:hypothetical protein